jgi:hypothetical protein
MSSSGASVVGAGQVGVVDVYRVLQSRLDSYRQSAWSFAGAAFVLLTVFDAALLRQDPALLPGSYIAIAAGMIFVIGALMFVVLGRIQTNFEEMTKVIVRIERRSGLHTAFYDEEPLIPWPDPWRDFTVKYARWAVVTVAVLHLILMAYLWLSHGAPAPPFPGFEPPRW